MRGRGKRLEEGVREVEEEEEEDEEDKDGYKKRWREDEEGNEVSTNLCEWRMYGKREFVLFISSFLFLSSSLPLLIISDTVWWN